MWSSWHQNEKVTKTAETEDREEEDEGRGVGWEEDWFMKGKERVGLLERGVKIGEEGVEDGQGGGRFLRTKTSDYIILHYTEILLIMSIDQEYSCSVMVKPVMVTSKLARSKN